MKKFEFSHIVSLILILAFGFGVYFLVKNGSDNGDKEPAPITETENKTPKLVDMTLVEEKTYKAPDQYAVFDVVYPQFENVSADFNKKIEDLVLEGIALHKKDAADNWQARYETSTPSDKISEFPKAAEKFSFNVSWVPVQLNKDFLSVLLTVSAYAGGAHGYENSVSFNYDVSDQEEITLKDLFPNDPNYLKTVSEFSRKDLTAQFRKNLAIKTKEDDQYFKNSLVPMLEAGTEPDAINFSVFTFTPTSITIYFAQYQVAPYAMGASKVVMPRK